MRVRFTAAILLRKTGTTTFFLLLALLVAPVHAASRVDPLQAMDIGAASALKSPSLDDIEHRTFEFFWQTANPRNGLVPDHWPPHPERDYFSSIAAVGFALTAYPIGVERGWITR
ncbi:MAG TPA: hypothetical protein VJQ42_01535, partial [Rhodanobacteraceae bacterium]|nr:hypothetical protein [Rhodanobacteraceae bacterium]